MTRTCSTLLTYASPLAELVKDRWKTIRVPAGAELLTQGEHPNTVFLLASGPVKLWRSNADGKVVIVGLRGGGWILGFSAAILNSSSVITATTMAVCQVHGIPSVDLRTSLQDSPPAFSALEMMSREVHEQLLERADLGMQPASVRLEQLLWSLVADSRGSQDAASLHLPLRFVELAQFPSVTPQYPRLARLTASDPFPGPRMSWVSYRARSPPGRR